MFRGFISQPLDTNNVGETALTPQSPSMRALNAAGSWIAKVRAFRQCRSSSQCFDVEDPQGIEDPGADVEHKSRHQDAGALGTQGRRLEMVIIKLSSNGMHHFFGRGKLGG